MSYLLSVNKLITVLLKTSSSLESAHDVLGGIIKSDEIDQVYHASSGSSDIWNALIARYGNDLQWLEQSYRELCYRACKADGIALEHVLGDWSESPDLYFIAVQNNGSALEFVPKTLPEQVYTDIAMRAVEHAPAAVMYLPRTLSAENKNKIYKKAVSVDGLALEYIFDPELDVDVCSTAIERNVYACEFVDQALRPQLFDESQLEAYLQRNYMTRRYFEGCESKIENFLEKVEHIVVFDINDIEDKEIEDGRRIYANALLRKGCVVCVARHDLEQLMNDLSQVSHQKDIKLCLLGHTNNRVKKIAGLSANDIVGLLKKYSMLSHVKLFGCQSLQAKKFDDEKKMIRKASKEMASNKCALFVTRDPSADNLERALASSKLNKAFVIMIQQNAGSVQYSLQYIEKDTTTGCVQSLHCADLSQASVGLLKKTWNKNKPFTVNYPKKLAFRTIRDSQHPLTHSELDILQNLLGSSVFEKDSLQYRQAKQKYPFLSNLNVSLAEGVSKLYSSMLQQLVQEIVESQLDREVSVKGYPHLLHVDTTEIRFHSSPHPIYTKGYYKHSLHTDSHLDNIDRKLLRRERVAWMKKIEEETLEGSTMVKSATITIPGLDWTRT